MSSSSLSSLFERAKNGDKRAENQIAGVFLPRALELAKRKLPVAPSPMVDHEDLAVSAIRSLCRCISDGTIEFRGDRMIGGLLRDIVVKKSAQYWRAESTQKRNRKNIANESDLATEDSGLQLAELAIGSSDGGHLNDQSVILSPHETKRFHEILENLERSMHGLFKELLRQLNGNPRKMLMMMLNSHYSNQELADELECSVASVERYRSSIKRKILQIADGT